jgi:anthranilate synthase/aminodeoxychorismate synthase-like glutamine amidotransferase
MHVLLIDNDDSFTWNIAQLIESQGAECTVRRNDAIALEDVRAMNPERIVLSPGPGRPEDSKVSLEILKHLSETIPTLGICLGHQAMACVFGSSDLVVRAPHAIHGKTSAVFHDGRSILKGIPSPFSVARYHSLLVNDVPPSFDRLCHATDDSDPSTELIMGMIHQHLPIVGLQFHPESFLSEYGDAILRNFLGDAWIPSLPS